jgi:hypothetical protein
LHVVNIVVAVDVVIVAVVIIVIVIAIVVELSRIPKHHTRNRAVTWQCSDSHVALQLRC